MQILRFVALAATAILVGCTSAPVEETGASSPDSTVGGQLEVSGSGVGRQPFGTDADEVVAAVTARFGEPARAEGPARYSRIPGHDGWFEVAEDPISPSWQYAVVSVACWSALCLIFGGHDADSVQLRGWELDLVPGQQSPDVHLAGTGIRLGDTWKKLHAAYPDAVVGGAEGASLAVQNTPWPGIFDGVAPWRLSGVWDYTRPHHVPPGAVVTRLSGGEGPEPGCC